MKLCHQRWTSLGSPERDQTGLPVPLCPLQFDYLARDSLYCGIKIGCDFNRIMQFSKVGLACRCTAACRLSAARL